MGMMDIRRRIIMSEPHKETQTGDVVSFPGTLRAPIGLVVNIEPVQDLHGQSSPYPAGGGTNILGMGEARTVTSGNLTAVVDDYGVVTINGSATEHTYVTGDEVTLPAGTYIIGRRIANTRIYVVVNGTSQGVSNTSQTFSFTLEEASTVSLGLRIDRNHTFANDTVSLSCNAGSSILPWSPYKNICPISGWTGTNIYLNGNAADGAKFYQGAIDQTYGRITSSTNRLYSDPISVSAGTYKIICDPDFANVVRVYDADMNFISAEGDGATWHENGRTITFTGDRKIRVMLSKNMGAQTTITPSEVQSFSVSPNTPTINIPFTFLANNLYFESAASKGKYISTSGTLGNSSVSNVSANLTVTDTNKYIINTDGYDGATRNICFWDDNTYLGYLQYSSVPYVFQPPSGATKMRISVVKDKNTFIGLETDGTVYGGTLDLNTGVMTVTKGFWKFSDLSWTYGSRYTRFEARVKSKEPAKGYYARNCPFMCSCYLPIYDGRTIGNVPNNAAYWGNTSDSPPVFFVKATEYSGDVTAFITARGNESFCYDLATPVTYQLTPQQLQSIKNTINNIWADTGKVTATFWTHL